MSLMPKAQYMKLSPAAKRKLKARLARLGVGAKVGRSTASDMYGKMRGQGDYYRAGGSTGFRKVKDASRGIGAQLGRNIGGRFGFGDEGAKLGGYAHSLFKQLTGFGDYKIKKNSIMMGTDPPSFGTLGRGTIIRHREFLGDVISSPTAGAFQLASFPIQPAYTNTFPWLGQIACCYEQYQLRGMVFEFKSTSSDALNSVNTALGTVVMVTEYNVTNPVFTNKAAMENHEYCTSGKPSGNILHPIECDPSQTPNNCYFTRQAIPLSVTAPTIGSILPVAGQDARQSEVGLFQIATVGCQGTNVNLGELWVTYDVELLKAQVRSNGSAGGPFSDHYFMPTGSITTAAPFGTTAPVLRVGSNCGSSINTATNSIILPQDVFPNRYMIQYVVFGTTATVIATQMTIAYGANVAPSLIWNGDLLNDFQTTAGDTSHFHTVNIVVQVGASATSTTNNVTFSLGTMPTGVVSGDVWVTYLPDNILTAPKWSVVRPPSHCDRKEDKTEEADDSEDDEKSDIDYEKLFKMLLKQQSKSSPEGKVEKKVDEDEDEYEAMLELVKLRKAAASSSASPLPPPPTSLPPTTPTTASAASVPPMPVMPPRSSSRK